MKNDLKNVSEDTSKDNLDTSLKDNIDTSLKDNMTNSKDNLDTTSNSASKDNYNISNNIIKNVLVVGTGGIGCELVKLLYISSECKITLIDFDTIELTNLNRQFLFTEEDIGKYKSEVVGSKIQKFTGWDITTLRDSIFNYDLDFFKQFDLVYNCLDNNETRTFVNTRCFLGKIKLIDGGSGGFKGQSCVFDYTKECFDCLPKAIQQNFNVCTIRTIPTKFEHCIEFAKGSFFDAEFDFRKLSKMDIKLYYKKFILKKLVVKNDIKRDKHFLKILKEDIKKSLKYIKKLVEKDGEILDYDKDNKDKVKLLYRLSCIRSKSAKIEVKTFFEFQSIANNIIPSLCTTNSIVASLMLISEKSNMNYFLTLNKRLYLELEPNEKNKDCYICSKNWIKIIIKEGCKALDLFKFLNRQFDVDCKYFMTEDNILYSKFPNNLDKNLEIKSNRIGTLGFDEDEILKIYVVKIGEKFEIVK